MAGGARAGGEAGTAVAEVAVTLPVILILSLHAALLTDLVRVRLRSLEAARFLAWEATTHRDPADVLADARARFLGAPSGSGGAPPFAVSPPRVELDLSRQAGGAGGQAGADGPGAVSGALDRFLGQARLPRTGWAAGEAALTVENRLVPRGVGAVRVGARRLGRPFTFRAREVVPVGRWTGWPAPDNRLGHTDPAAAPDDSYPLAERVTAAQVGALAFLGLGRLPGLDVLQDAARSLHLPAPLATGAARDGGPTRLGPADPASAPAFSPEASAGAPTRLGDRFGPAPFTVDTPDPGVDRSRYSLPFRLGTGHWWHTSGGYAHKPLPELLSDYADTRACRGPFQDGAVRADLPPRRTEAFRGCDGAALPGPDGGAPPPGLLDGLSAPGGAP